MSGFSWRKAREHYEFRPGYWFRPKMFGLGAVPVTWQGWLLTALYCAVAILIANLAKYRSMTWLVILIPLTLGFVLLAWIKTDGPWAFRWGPDK